MKKLWRTRRWEMIVSLLLAGLILWTGIKSRPYIAFGGEGLLMVAVVSYWLCRVLKGE